ncbi:IPT/TIG domain-containing protein [Actinoplanes sp. NPDC049118]|uniref:IPT/TIG domain-containing protein n=1 Tax=Actinoplanes sp. NPDC049118 TaxID=3155769 RepID=UPI00340D0C3A
MRKSERRAGAYLLRVGVAASVAAAAVLATSTAAFAVDTAITTLTPSTGPVGVSTPVTISETGIFTGVTAPVGRLNTAGTCPLNYGATTTTNLVAAVARTGNDGGTLTVPNTVPVGSWRVCLYSSTATTGTTIVGHSVGTYDVLPSTPVLTPSTGVPGTATPITATSATTFLPTTAVPGALFTTSTCPATWTTTGVTTATAVRTSSTVVTTTAPATLANGAYTLCIYNGTAGTSSLVGQAAFYALPSVTLSPAVGASATATPITITGSTAFLTGVAAPGVVFTRTDCTPTHGAGPANAGTGVAKLTNSKLLVTVPATVALAGPETSATYNACVYSGTTLSDPLIAAAGVYSIAPSVTVTAIAPTAGPAQGGSLVTITGTGFPFPATPGSVSVSLGGSPLTNVTVVSATSITGNTSSHAPGIVGVSVTTASGTKTLAASYTYSYGITVTPNTAPPATTPYLDIIGAGFSTLTWGTGSPALTDARVFLIDSTFDPTDNSGDWTGAPITECTSVIPIDDTEIICQLDLQNTLDADGTVNTTDVAPGPYTVAVVNDAAPGTIVVGDDMSIISSGSTFTVADF